jgi:hypothetical protein
VETKRSESWSEVLGEARRGESETGEAVGSKSSKGKQGRPKGPKRFLDSAYVGDGQESNLQAMPLERECGSAKEKCRQEIGGVRRRDEGFERLFSQTDPGVACACAIWMIRGAGLC